MKLDGDPAGRTLPGLNADPWNTFFNAGYTGSISVTVTFNRNASF
jgi:hypothetical protein